MGIDQLVSGGDVSNPTYESVTTDTLTDNKDGSAWETLREAGFETGDFIPLAASNTGSKTSTSSQSFGSVDDQNLEISFPESTLLPRSDVTALIVFNGDDNIECRLRRVLAGDTVGTFTANGANQTDAPVTVTLSTVRAYEIYKPQFRSTDGVSGDLFNLVCLLGVAI